MPQVRINGVTRRLNVLQATVPTAMLRNMEAATTEAELAAADARAAAEQAGVDTAAAVLYAHEQTDAAVAQAQQDVGAAVTYAHEQTDAAVAQAQSDVAAAVLYATTETDAAVQRSDSQTALAATATAQANTARDSANQAASDVASELARWGGLSVLEVLPGTSITLYAVDPVSFVASTMVIGGVEMATVKIMEA